MARDFQRTSAMITERRVGLARDRLAQAKARPLIAEEAVRIALRDAVAWRVGGGSSPNAEAFAAAAVAAARQTLDAVGADATERSRTLAAVLSVARRFTASALWRRLMLMPPSRVVRLAQMSGGPEVVVRDRHGHLHAIALKLAPDRLDCGRVATNVANATPLSAADRLTPLTVHVFSLATGRRQMYEREVLHSPLPTRVA